MPRYSPRTGLLQEYQVGPFDSQHLYVQWGGKLPGNEQWSCGFRLWSANPNSIDDDIGMLPAVAAAISAFHARADTQIGQAAKLSFVKCNTIAVSGAYAKQSTNEVQFPDYSGAGAAGFEPSNQIAWAVSTLTGFTRGPAHGGRFFLPLPTVAIVNGVVSQASADNLHNSADLLRTAVNAAAAPYVMAVMSRKAGSPGHRAITGFRVGRVLDTQRRRRRSLIEDYQ